MDLSPNNMKEHLLIFGASCSLKILNGTARFSSSNQNTYVIFVESSTVDYFLSSSVDSLSIENFEILGIQPESDHTPLLFSFSSSIFYVSSHL